MNHIEKYENKRIQEEQKHPEYDPSKYESKFLIKEYDFWSI